MVTVVLSTGRCGTQWLTRTLQRLYGDSLVVVHEPIGPLYEPRRFFRAYEDPEAILEVPDVRRHLDWIESLRRPYVETGWPLFAALPLFVTRFGADLRVIHLTRHPVPTALSHLAHSSYAGSPRDDAFTQLATLGPADPRVFQSGYAERWEELTPYEKCLFWITEVNLFGLEFESRYPFIAFLRVKSEQMLAGDRSQLRLLASHMGLTWDERWVQQTGDRVDRWSHHTDVEFDPLAIMRHPLAVHAARALGYDPADVDHAALDARYHGAPDAGLDRIGRFVSR